MSTDAPPQDQPPPRPAPNRRLRRLVLIGALSVLAALMVRNALAGGEDLVPWRGPAAGAAEARQTDRPMLIYFGAEWCTACRHLERHTFSHEHLAQRIERDYVPTKVDATAPGPEEQTLMGRYGAHELPTLVIADAQGEPIDRRVGTLPPDELLAWLDAQLPATSPQTPH